MEQLILMASAVEKGKSVTLKKSAADGAYYVQEVKTTPDERLVIVVASGIIEYEDAKLVFDRHAKRFFNEVGYEVTGG